jgi:nitronate monooxygenase
MLRTRFTEMFGLRHPVMSAPMAVHSGGTLAAAVSAAGGLGTFGGFNPWRGPTFIEEETATLRATTDAPFGIGYITPFLEAVPELFDAGLAARPAVIAFSFSDPGPYVERTKAVGSAVVCQVQTMDAADQAVEAGADVLAVQGTEAGGHTGQLSLLPFLAAAVARHPGVPMLAAGGIGDGRTLAAALLAGADGAWLGTAFLACPEAVEVHDAHKKMVVASDGGDTVWTRTFDIVQGFPWPPGIGERVRRNAFTEEWTGREVELTARRAEFAPPEGSNPFAESPDPDRDSVLYGQSAAFVSEMRPAAEVLEDITSAAEEILRSRPAALLG